MTPSLSSTSGEMTLTMSDGRVLKGTAKDGVFTYTSDEPLKWCAVDVQVTVNKQAEDRCHRTGNGVKARVKKAKKT